MLAAHHVTFQAGERKLLEDVSLAVQPGELLVVLGPNGAGKSTLLRHLSGELTPHAGDVRLDGQPLAGIPASALALRRAVVPQESPLPFAFTGQELVLLGRLPHPGRGESPHDLAIAEDCLAQVDATHLAHRDITTLSGGERQRLHLARALAQLAAADRHPPLSANSAGYLLLDEPTSNLDLAHQHLTLRVVRQLAHAGCGVLAILHDLNLASAYADRLALLAGGRLVAQGTPDEIFHPDLLRSVFGLDLIVQIPQPGARPICWCDLAKLPALASTPHQP